MVDLHSQHLSLKEKIKENLLNVFESSSFINGEEVKKFQKGMENYLNVKHVIPCASGTDALQLAFMALNLEPGSEVIIPAFTFISAAEVISLLGLKPVFVDIDPCHFTISPSEIEKSITPRTRAIVPIHLFGQCADMDNICRLAQIHHLYVIEDACQSMGADYFLKREDSSVTKMKSGTIGHIGCTSFFPSKNLGGCGDGGAVFTNDDLLADKIRMLANHGSAVKYKHQYVGINSRLDTLQAAILNVKLPLLDDFNQKRQQAADFYDKSLGICQKIKIPSRFKSSTHIFHQYSILCQNKEERDRLKTYLGENGIPSMIYYPAPLHLQECFSHLGYHRGDFPVSENVCDRILALPMHTELTNEQLNYISVRILDFFK